MCARRPWVASPALPRGAASPGAVPVRPVLSSRWSHLGTRSHLVRVLASPHGSTLRRPPPPVCRVKADTDPRASPDTPHTTPVYQQAGARCVAGELGAVVKIKLDLDPMSMAVDRLRTQGELPTILGVRVVFCRQPQHFRFLGS